MTKKSITSTKSIRTKRAAYLAGDSGSDMEFLLKLTLYVIMGSLWLKITHLGTSLSIPIPVGLLVGLLFTVNERFRVDRKIEYAVLIVAALFGFLAPFGLYMNL